jgi:hypothetical protein
MGCGFFSISTESNRTGPGDEDVTLKRWRIGKLVKLKGGHSSSASEALPLRHLIHTNGCI